MAPMLPALIGFAVVMYITPGPNNVMVASSAANYGIRATMPHMLGIALGFALMLTLVSAGLGSVLLAWPLLLPVMRWIGIAWLLWLGWKIATMPPPRTGERRRLLGFIGAAGFQWINPKAWLIAAGAASTFLLPDRALPPQLLRICLVFLGCAMPCLLVWALIGSGSGRLLRSPGRLRAFNLAMAALLVLSVLPVLFED
ncbi:MAG TPA: LysE family translocator [Acetobacteraceae bacterium]|nr:LysE family translocator [Acetobacteraceae bacterium]